MPRLNEPYRLTRHTFKTLPITGALFTCARPGRSLGSNQSRVDDKIVDAWFAGLPSAPGEIIIISLLGRKPGGLSELSYYSYYGGFDQADDRPGCATWQQWLTKRYGSRYRVCEFPTVDTEQIPEDTKRLLVNAILGFMKAGHMVLVVDSGGIGRTGNVVSMLKKLDMRTDR